MPTMSMRQSVVIDRERYFVEKKWKLIIHYAFTTNWHSMLLVNVLNLIIVRIIYGRQFLLAQNHNFCIELCFVCLNLPHHIMAALNTRANTV